MSGDPLFSLSVPAEMLLSPRYLKKNQHKWKKKKKSLEGLILS